MKKESILIIDDEIQIRKLLEITLKSNDYVVLEAQNGKEGIAMAASHQPDMVLLDIGLPDISGHEVLQNLRTWYSKPVLMLSAMSGEDNIVKALDAGANDYLVKPFRTGELLARIRTALRSANNEESTAVIVFGDLSIDLAKQIIKKANETIKLTATEYNLLALMVQNTGKVLTHSYLLKQVWGPSYAAESQYLRVFIAQLRKKIEAEPNNPKIIVTESGIGYRFAG